MRCSNSNKQLLVVRTSDFNDGGSLNQTKLEVFERIVRQFKLRILTNTQVGSRVQQHFHTTIDSCLDQIPGLQILFDR